MTGEDRYIGKIKFYDESKNYGYIHAPGFEFDIYWSKKEFERSRIIDVKSGMSVSFYAYRGAGEFEDRFEACDVKLHESTDQYKPDFRRDQTPTHHWSGDAYINGKLFHMVIVGNQIRFDGEHSKDHTFIVRQFSELKSLEFQDGIFYDELKLLGGGPVLIFSSAWFSNLKRPHEIIIKLMKKPK